MPVGRRTREVARVVAAKVDAMTAALRGIVVAILALTVAVVALAVRAA